MEKDNPIAALLLGLLGWGLLGAFGWMFSSTEYSGLLTTEVPLGEIIERADSEWRNSSISQYELQRVIDIRFEESLSHFAQTQLTPAQISKLNGVLFWEISYRERKIDENEGEDRDSPSLSLVYDRTGRLVEFGRNYPNLVDSVRLNGQEAQQMAKRFLSGEGVDTTGFQILEKESKLAAGRQQHQLVFTAPNAVSDSLKNRYEVDLTGNTVTRYQSQVVIDREKFKFSETAELVNTVIGIAGVVLWMILIILLLSGLFKRLKHDELNFRWALPLGVFMAVLVALLIGISSWPVWLVVLLGGGLGGVFSGALFTLVFAVVESYNRDIWPEKFALLDLLFQGKLRLKELGQAILYAVFLAGLAVFWIGLMAKFMDLLEIGYLEIKQDDLWVYTDLPSLSTALIGHTVRTLFVGMIILSFVVTYVRRKVSHPGKLIAIAAPILLLSALGNLFLQPLYWMLLLLLPVACVWAWAVWRFELVTILLAFWLALGFLDLGFVSLQPQGLLSISGMVYLVIFVLLFLAGVALLFSPWKVADYEHFVPEYVSRIAERERILQELEIARHIQFKFLPQDSPRFAGLDIASICKPAMEVGGDYFDFLHYPKNSLGVVVGDVSGKGVSAAFYMTMTKGIIKTLAKKLNSPRQILAEANEIFFENAPRNIFVSVLYGIFDLDDNTLTFARAGHNPLLVRKGHKAALELLDPKGLAIGLEGGAMFSKIIEEKSIAIEPGDVLVFYTDGISEAMNSRGEEYGEERLRQAIERHARRSAQGILDNITTEVFEFAGNAHQHDDFTMVVVKIAEK